MFAGARTSFDDAHHNNSFDAKMGDVWVRQTDQIMGMLTLFVHDGQIYQNLAEALLYKILYKSSLFVIRSSLEGPAHPSLDCPTHPRTKQSLVWIGQGSKSIIYTKQVL